MRGKFIAVAATSILLLLSSVRVTAQDKPSGFLGVSMRDLNDGERQKTGVKKGGCLLVKISSGMPAAAAGLKDNDVVLKCNGKEIETNVAFSAMLHELPPGAQITLTILRDGKTLEIKATLGKRPDAERKLSPVSRWGGAWGGTLNIDELMKKMQVARVNVGPGGSSAVIILPEQTDAKEMLMKAEALELNGKWEEASEIYQSLIENMSERVVPISEGHYVSAREYCEKLITDGPPERMKAYRRSFDSDAERFFKEAQSSRNGDMILTLAENYALTTPGEQLLVAAGVSMMERGTYPEAVYFFKKLFRFYPDSRYMSGIVLPSLIRCYKELDDERNMEGVREYVATRKLGAAPVVINRKKFPLSDIVGAPSAVAKETSYETTVDYFLPHVPIGQAAPARKWQAACNQISLPMEEGGTLFFEDNAGAHSIAIATGAQKNGVVSPLLPGTIKTPGTKPWEASPEISKIKSNILRSANAFYLCYQYFDKANNFSESRLCKIDGTSGRILWTTVLCSAVQTGDIPQRYSLSLSSDILFVATNTGLVAAIEVFSGSLKWIVRYESKVLTQNSGKWIIQTGNKVETSEDEKRAQFEMKSCPVVVEDDIALVLPTDSSALLAIDIRSGQVVWKYAVEKKDFPVFEGVVNEKVILSRHGKVVALDLRKGMVVWEKGVNDLAQCGKGALTADALYIPSTEGLYRVNLANGASTVCHRWKDPESEAGTVMLVKEGMITISPSAINFFTVGK